jgi:hypothetical protein
VRDRIPFEQSSAMRCTRDIGRGHPGLLRERMREDHDVPAMEEAEDPVVGVAGASPQLVDSVLEVVRIGARSSRPAAARRISFA